MILDSKSIKLLEKTRFNLMLPFNPRWFGNPNQKLRLTTDNEELVIFFIGVGSAKARKHFQTNLLIIKGNAHVMVDFGRTAPDALKKMARLDPSDLDVFLITHSHADHIGGLEDVALDYRYDKRFKGLPRPKMIISETYQETLWDRSLRGGLEWNEEDGASHRHLSFTDYFEPIRPIWVRNNPREAFEVVIDGLHLEMFRTKHIPDNSNGWQDSFWSTGLFIDGRVFVSMDTRFDRELIDEYADRSVTMFHDVQFFTGAVHAPLSDLKTLPDEIKKKMYLMHYADNWQSQDISGFGGWAEQGVEYVF